jgi:hypothetical protein
MTTNQKVWLISLIIVLVCILAALLIYIYTGSIVIALFIAPPIIHWILRKQVGGDSLQ